MITAIQLIAGFVLLWKGGDLLVEGADRFSRSHGVPPTLAGVFILGFGTSFPELATSVLAVLKDKPGIAVGNVVGSNITNVALILGITATLAAVPVNRFLFRVEIPVGILASGLAFVLVMDGDIGLEDGVALLVAFSIYALVALRTVHLRDLDEDERPRKRAWFDLGQAALALCAVVGGAELFLSGATTLADWWGLSDTAVGLTLVALGTSLPELATAIATVRARKLDLALGNIIGSNIFNLLLVLGIAGVMRSQPAAGRLVTTDMPYMLALAFVPWIAGAFGWKIGRKAGIAMVLSYLTWVLLFTK